MAYTSVLPVHRLDRSIEYVKDRAKTTKSAGSLEEAIDYALNREKTEQTIFEDAIGCTCENAYVDMVKTKERFHKKEGVQGYHLVQSFAEGEVSPELAHLIGQELAEQLLKSGKFPLWKLHLCFSIHLLDLWTQDLLPDFCLPISFSQGTQTDIPLHPRCL